METFNFPIETKPTGTVNFRTRSVGFGEGYEQRVGDGLNTKVQIWNVTIDNSYEVTQQVMDFLDRHSGYIAFQWVPPGRSEPRKYICEGYTEVPHVGEQRRIQATFREDFRP